MQVGDVVFHPATPHIRCRIVRLKDGWASFEVVKRDGTRDRRYERFSGSIAGYRKEE